MLHKMPELTKKQAQNILLGNLTTVHGGQNIESYCFELIRKKISEKNLQKMSLDPDSEEYSEATNLLSALVVLAMKIKNGTYFDIRDVFILSNISSI